MATAERENLAAPSVSRRVKGRTVDDDVGTGSINTVPYSGSETEMEGKKKPLVLSTLFWRAAGI